MTIKRPEKKRSESQPPIRAHELSKCKLVWWCGGLSPAPAQQLVSDCASLGSGSAACSRQIDGLTTLPVAVTTRWIGERQHRGDTGIDGERTLVILWWRAHRSFGCHEHALTATACRQLTATTTMLRADAAAVKN